MLSACTAPDQTSVHASWPRSARIDSALILPRCSSAGLASTCASLLSLPTSPCAAAKLDEVSRKVSVLTSFVEEPAKEAEAAPAPPAEDAEDDADEGDEEEAEAAGEDDEEVYDDGLDDNEGAGGCGVCQPAAGASPATAPAKREAAPACAQHPAPASSPRAALAEEEEEGTEEDDAAGAAEEEDDYDDSEL